MESQLPKTKEELEEQMVDDAFQHLKDTYLASRHRKKIDIINKAFNFARQAHKGVKRLSGEPYILHPIAVAQIACEEMGLGSTSISAALLHDVVEDTDYTVEDIENIFGAKIAQIVDGLRTDTRNMTAAAALLTQPLYMGGKIRAYDRITRYSEQVAEQGLRAEEQEVVLEADQAYWQVVSLSNKQRLAVSYRDMLRHLDEDVTKMIAEGVATKANGLSVSVKLNEAEMTLTKVENGLSLSRMLLCQVCGLPLDTPIKLADETLTDLPTLTPEAQADTVTAFANRPELNQLETAVNIYREKVNIERSAFLPQLALMGGYLTTNPNVFNGFEKKFRGTWAVGLTLKVPVWNWGEGKYKVRAAKAETQIAALQFDDAKEKIALQVNQSAFRVNEANKQLQLSLNNLSKADENLRTAQVGFKESVVTTSDLLAAQTAWLQANSEKIDAQIEVRLTNAAMRKALGTLNVNE